MQCIVSNTENCKHGIEGERERGREEEREREGERERESERAREGERERESVYALQNVT